MDKIEEVIKKERSNIKTNSLNTYLSNIRKVFKEVFANDVDMKHFNQFIKVKNHLETLTPATRKNIMIALMVLLRAHKVNKTVLTKYEKYFEHLNIEYENNYNKQIKSEKEEKNWITKQDIDIKLNELEIKIKEINTDDPTKYDIDLIQQHLVLSLYIGKHIPPMRNDYATMRISSIELKDENYIDIQK